MSVGSSKRFAKAVLGGIRMFSRTLIRLCLLRMALSRYPERAVDFMIEQSWLRVVSLVGEDELRRAVEFDRALLAERN